MLLASLGLETFLTQLFMHSPLLNSGLFTVPVSFLVVYLTGWAVTAFTRKMKSVKSDPSMPVVDPPGWSDRR